MPKQLTLLEKFDKNEARQLELVELLGKEIGNLKYYRTSTAFSDFTGTEKAEITERINTILYWVASLAYHQSRGLNKFRKHDLQSFLKSTQDSVALLQSMPFDHEIVREFYGNGLRRMRTLLTVNKDILQYRLKEVNLILDNYSKLIHL
jgi:hypothetical protein